MRRQELYLQLLLRVGRENEAQQRQIQAYEAKNEHVQYHMKTVTK